MPHALRRPATTAIAAVLAALVAVAGCASDDEPSAGPSVVATTSILGDLVSSLVGEDARVTVLVPVGSDPHAYELSARQRVELADASLVVANGLGLEGALDDALDSAVEADGVTIVRLGESIDALSGDDDHDHADEDADHAEEGAADADHAEEGADPHFWHDPTRTAEAVPALVEALAEALPGIGATALREREAALLADLADVDAEIEAMVADVPVAERLLVTHHATLGYFADRYGFEVVGIVVPGLDTLAEPSARDLTELAELLRDRGVRALFTDTTAPSGLSDAAAAEVPGVEVVALHTESLGEPGSDAATYLGMLRSNARLIVDALD